MTGAEHPSDKWDPTVVSTFAMRMTTWEGQDFVAIVVGNEDRALTTLWGPEALADLLTLLERYDHGTPFPTEPGTEWRGGA